MKLMSGIERWSGLSALGAAAEPAWGVAPGWYRAGALLLMSLPPLAEQRRIVAKVDQLMALVDGLETQLAASRATAANLLSALVAELTAASANGANGALPSQPGATPQA